jgi:3-oxoacyl-[acyl-carrier-protein] synthase-1
MSELFLSALGIISPLGCDKQETFSNLINGSTGGIVSRDDFLPDKPIKLGSVLADLPAIPAHLASHNIRCNQLLLAAYLQIKQEVDEAINKFGKHRIAVIIGSGTSGIDEVQQAIEKTMQNNTPVEFAGSPLEIGSPSAFLAEYLGLQNINYTISTACTSSAKAFASARNLINMGLCDAVIVGGSDNLCKLTVAGFIALESVAKDACNPFSKNRDGITLGEGAAIFLLTLDKSTTALLGIGESSDAYHNTSPDPSGKGAISAIKAALYEASLSPADIDYVNLHGTGTLLNDQMESTAMRELCLSETYSSSTKPLTGHTLGSAGIIEIALCWLLLSDLNHDKFLPPHIFDGETDVELAPLKLVERNTRAKKLTVCMSNSFAFGGSNVSLIIGNV